MTNIGINKVTIVYFSGTGGTARIAESFSEELKKHCQTVHKFELHNNKSYEDIRTLLDNEDLLLILYPVYALNAPKPVYEFIKKLPNVNHTSAVVLSVSGGGEITPNTACRLHCIKRLEKKGYHVVYEQMLVMPSNFIIPTPTELCVRLLEVLPAKVEKIVSDLLCGVSNRTRPHLLDRLLSCIGELEKSRIGAPFFGKRMKVRKDCTGCGLCESSCPRKNIILKNNIPVFGGSCVLCLKCLYNCPQKALTLPIIKFIILKQGYDLATYENFTTDAEISSIEDLAKGYALSGIKKYLIEDEKKR